MSAEKPSRLPIFILIGAAVSVAGGAAYWWSGQQGSVTADRSVQATIAIAQPDPVRPAEPSADGGVAAKEATAGNADQAENAEPDAILPADSAVELAEDGPGPTIQEVRLETDGLSVIAGTADPLSEVVLFVDDTEVARVETDASGSFATLATLEELETSIALPLTIVQQGSDGQVVRGKDTIFLAPTPQLVLNTSQDVTPDVPEQSIAASPTDLVATSPTAPAANVAELAAPVGATVQDTSAELADDSPRRAKPTKIAVLKSDESGVEVLNPPGPAPNVSGQVALDTISYSVDGAVKLQGRARSGAETVRVYLDNSAIAALTVDESGAWRGTLPDIDTGVFTLRIDEVAPDGEVTSRVETPFKREDPLVLEAALARDKEALIKAITVQQGHTLWAIARERYGQGIEYVQVFEANRSLIRDPDLIYPGQVLSLPQK